MENEMILKPEWIIASAALALSISIAGVGLTAWAVNRADRTDAVTVAATAINIRLDRLFDQQEILSRTMAVFQEKVLEVETHVADARGNYASLDVRLRAIENNELANHNDATKALSRRP